MWTVFLYVWIILGPSIGYLVGARLTDSYWRLCGQGNPFSRMPVKTSTDEYFYVVPEDDYLFLTRRRNLANKPGEN